MNEIVQGERLKRREFIIKPEEYLEDKGEKGGVSAKRKRMNGQKTGEVGTVSHPMKKQSQKLGAVDST